MLYVPDGLIGSCIDAIRVLANPAEKHRAHITVRGPYRRRGNRSDKVSRFVEGSEILVEGPGNFFASGQNTVYLRCMSPGLEAVWHKPDYEFNPHITLYDGSSEEFARRLWDIVSTRTFNLLFIAGPLRPLMSSRRYQGGMALRADLDLRLLREVTGVAIDEVAIENLGDDARLKAIGKLCDYLSTRQSLLVLPGCRGIAHEATVVEISNDDGTSKVLSTIKTLAKKNNATLGFLPEGAFDAYARRGWILAAMIDGDLAGYVIFRVSRMRAVLVHLCTNEEYRGRGIARRLFRSVVERTTELRGIVANSRRDFPAHSMWPRLGFAAVGERPGRGMNGAVLTRWWYEHPHRTLFSNEASYVGTRAPIDVAIDLNVFYDLVIPSYREGTEGSRSLQSDWLGDEIQLCATAELFNEINELASPQVRQQQRTLAHEFKRISGTVEAFDRTYSLLSSLMGTSGNCRQPSGLRHLAHTAAANVEFFVTGDVGILELQKEIERQTGVTPIRPVDLVVEIEDIRDIASYQPLRLRGSNLQVAKAETQQREKLEEVFVKNTLGETKSAFRRKLAAILRSDPGVDSEVVLDDGEQIALFCLKRTNRNSLTLPCLRLRHGPMARTLAREIITIAVESSIANNDHMTAVTDDWLEPYVEEALIEAGFAKAGAHWLKLNYFGIGTENDVAAGLERLLERVKDSGLQLPGMLQVPLQTGRRFTATETVLMEKTLRPLKLTNDTLDTVVIPVKPRWAQHLFDSGLAEQTLFGAHPDLLLSWENAYYRSSRSLGDISTPFRILWYVSQDSRYLGTGQIRAYAVGSSVEVLPAHVAYNKYKRLGVYEWQQVLSISGGDPDGPVMVIRFCDIEVFRNPIDRHRVSALLGLADNKKPSFRGPQRISETAFAGIYSEGQS